VFNVELSHSLARARGSVFGTYAYSAYGETVPLGPDGGNPLQYTGRENDGTGLYYYRARYYDPVLKRFVREDPIGIEGGLNLHGYVNGDPLSRIDPFGLAWGGANQAGYRRSSTTASAWFNSSSISFGTGSLGRLPLGCVCRISLKGGGQSTIYAGCGVVVGSPSFFVGPNVWSVTTDQGPSGPSAAYGFQIAPLPGSSFGGISASQTVSGSGTASSATYGLGAGVSLFATGGVTIPICTACP
jgi:RHS repeat-associated protein